MFVHPFTQSFWCKTIGIAVVLLLTAILSALLVFYINLSPTTAIIDAASYIGLLSLAAYFYWFIIESLRVIQAQIAVALSIQLICLAIAFGFLHFFDIEDMDTFIAAAPLRFVFGLLCWIILLQYYHRLELLEKREEREPEEVITPVEESKILEYISVKKGSHINIIRLEELLYIEAYGDYILLFTQKDKYIKEETMKYMEANLPASFVRIHRSYIVNTECITHIELFGKENYQVRLKNAEYLRVSNSGYKLLKDRLSL